MYSIRSASHKIVWNVFGNARTLHTKTTRARSLHSARALFGGRGSLLSIHPSHVGFATSIPSPAPIVDRFSEFQQLKRLRQHTDSDITEIAAKIVDVESSIKDVLDRINKSVVGSNDWSLLVAEKSQLHAQQSELRDKAKHRRDESQRLDEKKQVLDEEKERLDRKGQRLDLQTFPDFIEGIRRQHSKLDDIGRPYRLTKNPERLVQIALNRAPQIRQFLNYAWIRFKREGKDTDKSENPLLATQASPGMGKSSFIDVMTGLSREQIELYSPKAATPAFIDAMCGAIHLVVDLKELQPLTDYDVRYPTAGVAIRLLHTYFASTVMSYADFFRLVTSTFEPQSLSWTSLSCALCMIEQFHDRAKGVPVSCFDSKTLVFVYIDEFQRLGELTASKLKANEIHFPSSAMGDICPASSRLLSSVAGLISGNNLSNVFFSAADHKILFANSSDTHRETKFISLPLLDGHALFEQHPMYHEHPVVRLFVADLGGHARSLNELLLVLDDFQTSGESPTYASLSKALLLKLENFHENYGYRPLPARLIIRFVLRERIFLDKAIGELKESVESYVTSGDLFHSVKKCGFFDDYIVLRLSLFRIRLALTHAESTNTVLISTDADRYLRTLVGMDSEFKLSWSGFENYFTNFEALRHCLLALDGAESKTVSELYPGAIVGKDKSILDLPIPIVARHCVEYLTVPFVPSIAAATVNKNKVLVSRSGNAGFDVVIPFGEESFIFLHCCQASSSTVAIAIEQNNLIKNSINSISKADRPKSYILVMLAIGNSTPKPALEDIAQLPSNVIIVDRKQICEVFGEAFSARGSLIMDQCAKLPVPKKTKKVGVIESLADSAKL